MDFYVVMGRPGQRVARRKQKKARVGFTHKVKKEDTMSWFKQRFDGILVVSAILRGASNMHADLGRALYRNSCLALVSCCSSTMTLLPAMYHACHFQNSRDRGNAWWERYGRVMYDFQAPFPDVVGQSLRVLALLNAAVGP